MAPTYSDYPQMTQAETQKWQWLALTVLIGALLYLLAPVLTPFALAALFAYLGDPLVDRLERWRLSRSLAVTVVFLAMTLALVALVLILVPLIERQTERFIQNLPRYIEWFRSKAAPWLEQNLGLSPELLDSERLIAMLQEHWRTAGGVAATVLAQVSKSGLAVIGWFANLVLIPVVTFYLLRDWDVLIARIHELIPRPIEPTVARLARESDVVLGAFLRGQLSVMFALGLLYSIGLWAIGIDVAVLIGLLAGLVSFVPYLGVIVGAGAGVIAALVQYQDWWHVFLVLGVFGIGQLLEGFVMTPKLVGDKIGLHPVAVIFAVLAGGQLFGFLGVLLALPVASVVMILLRYAHERYTASQLYGAPAAAGSAAAGAAANKEEQTGQYEAIDQPNAPSSNPVSEVAAPASAPAAIATQKAPPHP